MNMARNSVKTMFIYKICGCVQLAGRFMNVFHIPESGADKKNTKNKKTVSSNFRSGVLPLRHLSQAAL